MGVELLIRCRDVIIYVFRVFLIYYVNANVAIVNNALDIDKYF